METTGSQYDLLLVAIAFPLVCAALAGALFPISTSVALGAGSVPAGGGVGYALFYEPPEPADGE